MIRLKTVVFLTLLCVGIFCHMENAAAADQPRLHPMNKKLVQQGLMPVPKYYPHIPRITAETAYGLYLQNKALFVYVSYSDKNLIVGGIHFTEDKPGSFNPNKLPFKPGQILVVY